MTDPAKVYQKVKHVNTPVNKLNEINKLPNNSNTKDINYFDEHNKDYLDICYYNLKEKYLRKGISDNEWELIENKYKKIKED